MGITRLKRKARRNKQTASKRNSSIKHLTSTPVIKNIDREALIASFPVAEAPAKVKEEPKTKAEPKAKAAPKAKAEKVAKAPKAEAVVEETPKAEKKPKAKTAPAKKAPKAKKEEKSAE